MNHVNATVDQIERPLLTPDEVMRIRPPKKTGHGTNSERITAPGDMLIFVSGHFPIYGTQMLYFLDKTLAARAKIPPPTKFHTIAAGRPVPQPPPDRTPNVISRAEPKQSNPFEAAFTHGF
jgi:type IV secretion system protein VirD4